MRLPSYSGGFWPIGSVLVARWVIERVGARSRRDFDGAIHSLVSYVNNSRARNTRDMRSGELIVLGNFKGFPELLYKRNCTMIIVISRICYIFGHPQHQNKVNFGA